MTPTSSQRPTHVRYLVLAALCAVTVINYVQRNSIGGMETTIRPALNIDQTDTGLAMAMFFWSYALMQIPTGLLARRWGPRLALTVYTVGWSLATATLALAVGVVSLCASRLVMGVLQAGIFPCATLIMSAWLPPARRALASGLLNSFMLIGGAVVSNLTAILLAPKGPLDWQPLFVVYAVPGLLFAAWFYWWFRDRPEQHSAVNAAELAVIAEGQQPAAAAKSRIAVRVVLLSLPLWLICGQQFLRAGANRFNDQWLPTYLQEVPLRHLDEGDRKRWANNLASIPMYAGVVGGLIGGFVSDRVLRRTGSRRAGRNGVAIVSLLLTVLLYLPIFFVESAPAQIAFLTLGYFVSTFASPCAYALTMDVGGKNLPVVFGAMNMFGNFGAAVITQVVPQLNRAAGGWRAALILFVAIHAVALVCWLFLNPNRTIGDTETR